MDRFRVAVCIVRGAAFGLLLTAVATSARAENQLPSVPSAAALTKSIDSLRNPAAGGKPLTIDQVRAKYAADRKFDEAVVLFRAKNIAGTQAALDEAFATYRQAGLLEGDRLYTSQFVLAIVAAEGDKHDEAAASFRQAIATAEKLDGRESAKVALVRNYFALYELHRTSDYARGRIAFEEIVAIYRKLGAAEEKELLGALQLLAGCEAVAEQFPQAIAHQKEVCERRAKLADVDQAELALSYRLLASFHFGALDMAAARVYFEESADLYEQAQGSDSADAKKSRGLALECLRLSGRAEAVDRIVKEGPALKEQIERLAAQKDFAALLPLVERRAELTRALYGDENKDSIEAIYDVARVFVALKKPAEAAEKHRELAKILKHWTVAPPAWKAPFLYKLAIAEMQIERFVEARPHMLEVIAYAQVEQNVELEKTIRRQLISLETHLKNPTGVLDQSVALFDLNYRPGRPIALSELMLHATLACDAGVEPQIRDRCRAQLEKILAAAIAEFGDQDEACAVIKLFLARFQYRCNDRRCVDTLAEMVALYGAIYTADTAASVATEICLAKYCSAFGELARAREILERSLVKLRAEKEPNVRQVFLALHHLAAIDAHDGRRAAAEAGYREAIALGENSAKAGDTALAAVRLKFERYLAGELPSLAARDNPEASVVDLEGRK